MTAQNLVLVAVAPVPVPVFASDTGAPVPTTAVIGSVRLAAIAAFRIVTAPFALLRRTRRRARSRRRPPR